MKPHRYLYGLFMCAACASGCGVKSPQDGAAGGSSSSTALGGQSQQSLQTLHNHVRPAVSSGRAALLEHLPAAQGLNVSIVLSARNEPALRDLLEQVYDPASPKYRQFLSVDQFTEQFAPTADDYQAVVDFAKANGLTVTDRPANRAIVALSGTVEQIERAFHVKMNRYQHPTENRTFFSPDREPSLALNVPVKHISGLNNYSVPHPTLKLSPAGRTTPTITGSGPGGTSYLASDMRAAYYSQSAGQTGLTGSGQTLGLVQFDGYNVSDVVLGSNGTVTSTPNGANFVLAYTPVAGGTTFDIPVHNVLLDGATGAPCQLVPGTCQDAEQSLDILQSIGMAPGLSQVRVYIGSSDVDILNAMATENLAKEISISWTWSPDDPATDDFIFQEMAAQGQSVFAASGDDGAYNAESEDVVGHFFPADDAWVTSVGGTHLTTSGATGGGAWSSETAWVQSGGGINLDGIPIPSWQGTVVGAANGGSATLRNVPDVAAEADFDNFVCNLGTCTGTAAGTSFAAPRWAGFLALANQQAAAAQRPPLGFVSPLMYAIGQGSSFNSDLHDITSGSNEFFTFPPFFNAVTGYDLVTGWGSPTGQNLINTLAPAASVGFQLSASPSGVTVDPSSSVATTIAVGDVGGFSGKVTLSISGLPNGLTASFGTNPTSTSSVLTLTATSTVVRGSYLLTVTGVSGTLSASTSLALEVNAPGFSVVPSQAVATLYPGSAVANPIDIQDFAGFTGNVTLAVTSPLPAGVTASWLSNPSSVDSVLTLTASNTASIASEHNEVTVTGVSGGLVETATFELNMFSPAFSVALSPLPHNVAAGGSVTSTLSVIPFGAFDNPVTFTSSLPTGFTDTFGTNPVTTSTPVTFTASSTAPLGTSSLALVGNFTAVEAGTTGSAAEEIFNLNVTAAPTPGFVLDVSPVAMTVTQGGTASSKVTVDDLNGFTGNVSLVTEGSLPLGITASIDPTTNVLTVAASSSAQVGFVGNQAVVGLGGNADTVTASTNYFFTVAPAPLFTLGAASVTVAAGSSVQDTITLTPQTGFTGNAALTVTGLPGGVTGAFTTNPLTSSSVLTLTATSGAPPGQYLAILEGTSGVNGVTLPITVTVTSGSDAGAGSDGGSASDASIADSGSASDASVADSGSASDASVADSGSASDASIADSSTSDGSGPALPCSSPIAVSGPGNFNLSTSGPACFAVPASAVQSFFGWSCSSCSGVTVAVDNTAVSIGATPLPPVWSDGNYYFNFSKAPFAWSQWNFWN